MIFNGCLNDQVKSLQEMYNPPDNFQTPQFNPNIKKKKKKKAKQTYVPPAVMEQEIQDTKMKFFDKTSNLNPSL